MSDNTTELQRNIWHCEDCGCSMQLMALNMYHYWTAPWEMHERAGWLADCRLTAGRGDHLDEAA